MSWAELCDDGRSLLGVGSVTCMVNDRRYPQRVGKQKDPGRGEWGVWISVRNYDG
jgi:hypothetical protein